MLRGSIAPLAWVVKSILIAAGNYASGLVDLKRFQEAKALVRKMMPVARRVLGKSDETTLRMRAIYARALCEDPAATLDDFREAVTTLEDAAPTARRVLGGAHPTTGGLERELQAARAALRACKGAAPGDVSSICEKVGAMNMRDG